MLLRLRNTEAVWLHMGHTITCSTAVLVQRNGDMRDLVGRAVEARWPGVWNLTALV